VSTAEPTDLAAYDYDLPREAIAQEPTPERDASRLLVLSRETGAIAHHVFRDLPDLLEPGDLVVFNRSRVFPARLLGRRRGGGAAEVLLVRPLGAAEWEALVRPGRRLRPGDVVEIDDEVAVEILAPSAGHEGCRRVRIVAPTGGDDTAALIERHGHVPLPPYIRRPDRAEDRSRYQTVYAREPGSVAAPTAGLHFTPALLERLGERGVRTAALVLHVGPGTFRPVTVEDVSRHRLAPEPYLLPQETAEAVAETRARGGRVVAVGTTTVRVLETRARPGGQVDAGAGETALVLAPGAQFGVVDALVTNFHLPRSSLLLLVCAFAGRARVLDAYRQALAAGYRFYSYGDAMLVR
jgi:S-adenosylmethionine:tRNA ribosyltransferase-isomerase